MSIYQVNVCRLGGNHSARYIVAANEFEDACMIAMSAHAELEDIDASQVEVVSLMKTDYRAIISPEFMYPKRPGEP